MARQIKLVALDIDGTILDSQANLSKNTIDIIRELKMSGVNIVLATGRVYLSAHNIMKKLSIETSIISYNGGNVYIPSVGEIFNIKIPLDISKKVLKYGAEKDLYTKVYIDDVLYVKGNDPETIKFSQNHGIKYKAVGDLEENINQDVNMIVMFSKGKDDEIDSCLNELDLSMTSSTPYCKEFLPKGISKATGLKLVSEYFGIERQEILAIGNGLNDLEMIKYSGLGIAMKNSDFNLIKDCDNISNFTNDEEGVYHILKELMINGSFY